MDGVIHTAFFHQITQMGLGTRLRVILGGSPSGIPLRFLTAAVTADRRALETLGQALARPDRPLVAAFGTMAMKPGQLATEEEAYDPNSVGGPRGETENAMMALASRGVRASVIRLPPLVHGDGDRSGFGPQLIRIRSKKGLLAQCCDGPTDGPRCIGWMRHVSSGWRWRRERRERHITLLPKRASRSRTSPRSLADA